MLSEVTISPKKIVVLSAEILSVALFCLIFRILMLGRTFSNDSPLDLMLLVDNDSMPVYIWLGSVGCLHWDAVCAPLVIHTI